MLGSVGWVPEWQLGQPHLRPVELIHRQLVQTQPQAIQPGLDREPQHLPGDAVVHAEQGLAERFESGPDRSQVGFLLGPAYWSDVRQAIVVPIVGIERGQRWIAAEDAFPVVLGQLMQRLSRVVLHRSLSLSWPARSEVR